MADPNQIADLAERLAESAVPGLAAFHPLIALISTAIISHFQATKTFPTEAEIVAALPVDYQKVLSGWSAWTPSGDGTLSPPKAP
jgi:hypothetical protein